MKKELLNPYLLIQGVRLGLRKDQVQLAANLLDTPWEELRHRAGEQFRHRFSLSDADPFHWLAQQKVRTKDDIREAMTALTSSSKRRMETRRTSGSSGTPLRLYRDREMAAWMEATALALYSWHGLEPWQRQARFWGGPPGPWGRLRQSVKDRVLGRRRLRPYSLSDLECRRFFNVLRRYKPTHAYGYPSVIAEYASICESTGLDGRDLGLQAVVCTGEPLLPPVRSHLSEFFSARIINEYGCTESGILGFECESGTMHLTPVATWIETIQEENGEPAEDQPGTVLLTDLVGGPGPFRRYRLGDVVRLTETKECSCGRDLPQMKVERGRVKSMIVHPDGRRTSDAVLAYAAPEGVQSFQGRQTTPDRLEVDVVPRAGADPEMVRATFEKALRGVVGSGLTVEVSTVSRVRRSSSGKLRYFVPLSDSDE